MDSTNFYILMSIGILALVLVSYFVIVSLDEESCIKQEEPIKEETKKEVESNKQDLFNGDDFVRLTQKLMFNSAKLAAHLFFK